LQDTEKELAEMLNHLQHHTKCEPGYCEQKKKGSGEILVILKHAEIIQSSPKTQAEIVWN
jgi:hypothetical protein